MPPEVPGSATQKGNSRSVDKGRATLPCANEVALCREGARCPQEPPGRTRNPTQRGQGGKGQDTKPNFILECSQ